MHKPGMLLKNPSTTNLHRWCQFASLNRKVALQDREPPDLFEAHLPEKVKEVTPAIEDAVTLRIDRKR